MVDKKVVTVSVTDHESYKDKNGDVKTESMGPVDHDGEQKPGHTDDTGHLGTTLLPDKMLQDHQLMII